MQRHHEITKQDEVTVCGLSVEARVVDPDAGETDRQPAREGVRPRLAVRQEQTFRVLPPIVRPSGVSRSRAADRARESRARSVWCVTGSSLLARRCETYNADEPAG